MFESTGWILEEPNVTDCEKYDLLVPTIVKPVDNNYTSEYNIQVRHSPIILLLPSVTKEKHMYIK